VRLAVALGTVAIVIACIVILTRGAPADPSRALEPPPPTVTTSPSPSPPAPAPTPVPAATPQPGTAPEATVARQLALIDAGKLDELRATFVPELRDRVTADVLARCQVRIHQVPVRPDWEMAEDDTDERGARVRRVSMFGKAMTGFHWQPDGSWLADAIWCLPVGLP